MKPSLATPPDVELIERMRKGAEEAFTALYRRHQGAVYRYALQMSGKAELAEDVTQEVFMALIRDGGRYDPGRGALIGYLVGIARNHLLRHRGEGAFYLQLTDDEDGSLPGLTQAQAASDNPLGDLTRRESIESLKQAIQGLPAHYREVVILCDLEEFSYQETASVLGCSLGTIRSRLHRAHALLTTRLKSPAAVEPAASQLKSRCFA
jgi:RNA polymerase sigma-70 factor, ECF subfamily